MLLEGDRQRREPVGLEDGVIHEACGQGLAVRVVHHLFHQARADRPRRAPPPRTRASGPPGPPPAAHRGARGGPAAARPPPPGGGRGPGGPALAMPRLPPVPMPNGKSVVSPALTITSSNAAPSSDAAIWASVVACPWPCAATPMRTYTLPLGSTRTVAPS